MNVTNDVTTTTTTTTNAATTTNSRRLSRLDDVDSTFNDLRDEAEETDASSHAPGTLRDYKTKYNEIVRWLKRKNVRDALNTPKTEIDFSSFKAIHLKAFLQTKKMIDGLFMEKILRI